MRKRMKRTMKRLLKLGKWVFVFVIGFFIGIATAAEGSTTRESVVIYNDSGSSSDQEREIIIERHFDNHVIDEIVIPPIPEIPEIPAVPPVPPVPEIPPIPDMPMTIYVDSSPSFFDVVNGISTILAALGLIGLGIFMLRRGRIGKEKSPESIAN